MNILAWESWKLEGLCLAIDNRSKMLNCIFNPAEGLIFNPAEGLMVQDVYKSKAVDNE